MLRSSVSSCQEWGKVVRTRVQANVVDLGGPGPSDVPTDVGADGHPHARALVLNMNMGA